MLEKKNERKSDLKEKELKLRAATVEEKVWTELKEKWGFLQFLKEKM